jgi:hypothetical protein
MTTEERSDVLPGTVEWISGAVPMETENKETRQHTVSGEIFTQTAPTSDFLL